MPYRSGDGDPAFGDEDVARHDVRLRRHIDIDFGTDQYRESVELLLRAHDDNDVPAFERCGRSRRQ